MKFFFKTLLNLFLVERDECFNWFMEAILPNNIYVVKYLLKIYHLILKYRLLTIKIYIMYLIKKFYFLNQVK